MKYLCMIYYDEKNLEALSQREFTDLVDDSLEYRDELIGSGHYVASNGLQPVQTATTLRIHDGKVSVTDGPFAETKEQLGGFYLIEASDLNEAIQLASKMPPGRLGCVEIRPVREMAHTKQASS